MENQETSLETPAEVINPTQDSFLRNVSLAFVIEASILALPGIAGVVVGYGLPLVIAIPGFFLLWGYNMCRKNSRSLKFQSRTWLFSAIYNGIGSASILSLAVSTFSTQRYNVPQSFLVFIFGFYLLKSVILSIMAYQRIERMRKG